MHTNIHVYWAALVWSPQNEPTNAMLDVASQAGARGFIRLRQPADRTDKARDLFVEKFRQLANDPNDTLVMLDFDHIHPHNIVERLALEAPAECGVVGGVYVMRQASTGHRPCFFIREADGSGYSTPATWPDDALIECDFVGTGGIAIRRWVFDRLEAAGYQPPFFRYVYDTEHFGRWPGEDSWFAHICQQAGIKHYVNTGVESPHMGTRQYGVDDWRAWCAAHPEALTE